MKATGIIRRLDDLGRIVVPKEIRRSIGAKESTPMEIFYDTKEGTIILKKYQPELDLISRIQDLDWALSDMDTDLEPVKIEEIRTHIRALEELLKQRED